MSSSIFSANAEPVAHNDLSSFGETQIHTVLESKGDKGKWLWCTTNDKVYKAVTTMSKANVGSLMVLDAIEAAESGNAANICGILTERDYLKKIVLEGRNSKDTDVVDIMTPNDMMMTIGPEDSVMEAMELMAENQIRHLPVLKDNKLVGMVSIRDVVSLAQTTGRVACLKCLLSEDGMTVSCFVQWNGTQVKVMVAEHKKSMEMMSSYISGTY